MKTVKEVTMLTGVSARTLHHYHAIGLLVPTEVTSAGYRLYGDKALQRLQSILLLRQLEFSLKEIGQILDSPGFDPLEALEQQIGLLELRRQQLDKLISNAREIQRTGVFTMDFSAFDDKKLKAYAAQAKEKWGKTEAYQEFTQKSKDKTDAQLQSEGDGLMDIFREMGMIRHTAPDGKQAQELVKKLQAYITSHYYTCTPQILQGLGQMYIAGDSMTENIDRAGGEGTAAFAAAAIAFYTLNH